MKSIKVLFGVAMLVIVASNLWSMLHWSERRGVIDDLCYLRQAHLFQEFGWRGIETDISSDTDGYFASMTREAGHPEWNSATAPICHTLMPATGKRVIQYPPGTGFVLAAFPEGFQVAPLYASATIMVLLVSLLAIGFAKRYSSTVLAGVFGCMALYFMINPAKASYSVAPTMVICAVGGFLTAALFNSVGLRMKVVAAALVGLLLGFSVAFRIPNLLFSAGYFAFFSGCFLLRRKFSLFVCGVVFGICYVIGLIPNFLANAVNAGSPFATTYSSVDVVAPSFTLTIFEQYLTDTQGLLLVVGIAWTICGLVWRKEGELRTAALVTGPNLIVSLTFFLSHPLYNPYYLLPIAMLSLWTLLFDHLCAQGMIPEAVRSQYENL